MKGSFLTQKYMSEVAVGSKGCGVIHPTSAVSFLIYLFLSRGRELKVCFIILIALDQRKHALFAPLQEH